MKLFYFTPLALLITTLCSPASFAASQQTASAHHDDSITVTANSRSSSYTTLGKLPLTLRETPQSVSVISRQQMEKQNLQTIEEVMRHTTGVTVSPHEHLTTAYYARGFHIDSFEQDGVPVLMTETAHLPDDTALYERIEVLRGVNGLLHGAGNPSATINLVRKRPQHQFAISGGLNAGSWNRYRGELDIGGPLNASGSLRGRVVGTFEDRGFFYEDAHQRGGLFYGIGELDLGENTLLSLGVQYQNTRANPHTSMYGLPRYSDGGDIGLKRSTNLESAGSLSHWKNTRVFAELEHHFNQDWSAKISANYLKANTYMKYLSVIGPIDREAGRKGKLSGMGMKFNDHQISVDAYVNGSIELFGRSHELVFGGNIIHSNTEAFWSEPIKPQEFSVIPNVFNWHPRNIPDYEVKNFELQKTRSVDTARIDQQGIYGMGRLSLAEPLTLVLGGRVSWWQEDTYTAHYRISPQFTPYGGLIFDLNQQWSLYASYAQVFLPQGEKTRDNQMLKPITGSNYEAGIKGEFADGALNTSLAVFQIEEQNRAQQEDALCRGRGCYYIADGKVRSRGIEAEISGNITPYWIMYAGYTFNTSRYLTDSIKQGQSVASFAPRHIFRLWTDYQLPILDRRLSVGGGLQVQSEFSPPGAPAKLRQGGYALADVRVAWQVDKHITLALNVNNLFDRVYYQRLNNAVGTNYYGEPRNFMLTLRADY